MSSSSGNSVSRVYVGPSFVFSASSRVVFCGPSLSGKSTRLLSFLANRHLLFEAEINNLLIFSGIVNTHLEESARSMGLQVEAHQGLDNLEEILKKQKDYLKNTLVLLEDLQDQLFTNKSVSKLLTMWTHHFYVGCLFITSQNLYESGKLQVTFNRNCSAFVLLRHRRMLSIVETLGRQLHLNQLAEIYKTHVLSKPRESYPYLLINLEGKDDRLLFMSNICEIPQVFMIEKVH